jgi:hypothetical protein
LGQTVLCPQAPVVCGKPKAKPSFSPKRWPGLGKTHWWKGNRALGVAIDCGLRFIMLERQQDFAPEGGMLLYLASPGP